MFTKYVSHLVNMFGFGEFLQQYMKISCACISPFDDFNPYDVISDPTAPKRLKSTQMWFYQNSQDEGMLFEPKNGFTSVLLRKLENTIYEVLMVENRDFAIKTHKNNLHHQFTYEKGFQSPEDI